MTMDVRYVRERSLVSSKYMNLIIQASQIANKLVPVDKRTISQIKRPHYVQKKDLQNINLRESRFFRVLI